MDLPLLKETDTLHIRYTAAYLMCSVVFGLFYILGVRLRTIEKTVFLDLFNHY